MNRLRSRAWLPQVRQSACRMAVACACAGLLSAACTIPGAVAPSTMPVTGKYVELGPYEQVESCGYVFFIVPIGSPDHIADMIDNLVKSRGGDALIDVTSGSSTNWYLLGGSNCVQLRGKIVKFSK